MIIKRYYNTNKYILQAQCGYMYVDKKATVFMIIPIGNLIKCK